MYGNASKAVREAIRLLDRQDWLNTLRADLDEVEARIDRGEYPEESPEFWDSLTVEAERMEREGIEPDPLVYP